MTNFKYYQQMKVRLMTKDYKIFTKEFYENLFQNEYFIYGKRDGAYNFIDKNGEIVAGDNYALIRTCDSLSIPKGDGRFAIIIDKYTKDWGVVNQNLETVLPMRYLGAFVINNRIYAITDYNNFNVFDLTGNFIKSGKIFLKGLNKQISNFFTEDSENTIISWIKAVENLASVNFNTEHIVIPEELPKDQNGAYYYQIPLNDCKYNLGGYFKTSIIDDKVEPFKVLEVDYITNKSQEYISAPCRCSVNGKYYILLEDLKLSTGYDYIFSNEHEENTVFITKCDKKYGLIATSGNETLRPKYTLITETNKNYIVYKDDISMGAWSPTGECVVPLIIYGFNEHRHALETCTSLEDYIQKIGTYKYYMERLAREFFKLEGRVLKTINNLYNKFIKN